MCINDFLVLLYSTRGFVKDMALYKQLKLLLLLLLPISQQKCCRGGRPQSEKTMTPASGGAKIVTSTSKVGPEVSRLMHHYTMIFFCLVDISSVECDKSHSSLWAFTKTCTNIEWITKTLRFSYTSFIYYCQPSIVHITNSRFVSPAVA